MIDCHKNVLVKTMKTFLKAIKFDYSNIENNKEKDLIKEA